MGHHIGVGTFKCVHRTTDPVPAEPNDFLPLSSFENLESSTGYFGAGGEKKGFLDDRMNQGNRATSKFPEILETGNARFRRK